VIQKWNEVVIVFDVNNTVPVIIFSLPNLQWGQIGCIPVVCCFYQFILICHIVFTLEADRCN